LLAAYYGTPPEQASAALYHGLARVGLHVTVHAFRGGAAHFAASLAAALAGKGVQFSYGAAVSAVTAGESGASVVTGEAELPYDGVVVATSPAAAAGLVSAAGAREWLAAVPTRPAVSVVLWLRKRVRTASFGYSFPRREPPGDVLAAACIQSRKLDFGREPGDGVVALLAPALLDRDPSDDQLLTLVRQALELPLPGIGRVIEAVEVHRLAGGYRQFPPGYIRRLVESPPPDLGRIMLAGDYLVAPTVEGAVRSGLRAAERLLERV
jgi:oxygen-dependent protoporphyrinogen oxidase